MQVKESMAFSLICAVVFVQFIIVVANINNFTSLHKQKESIQSDIKKAESEQSNNVSEINRELNNNFSEANNSESLTKIFPSEIEKLQTPEEIEEEKQRDSSSGIIIIQ